MTDPSISEMRKSVLAESLELLANNQFIECETALNLAEKHGYPTPIIEDMVGTEQKLFQTLHDHNDLYVNENYGSDSTMNFHDALFELIFMRLEAMQPFHSHLQSIYDVKNGGVCRPVLFNPARLKHVVTEIENKLNVDDSPIQATTLKIGLATLYSATFFQWCQDSAPEFSKTMRTLDRGISRLESLRQGEIKSIIPDIKPLINRAFSGLK